jgi:hypothetical protein
MFNKMDTHFDTAAWIDSVVIYWRDKGIRLEKGATDRQINDAEHFLGFQFPSTFSALYKKVNGFKDNECNENTISIWSISRILQEQRYPNFVAFSDYLINSHVYGFIKNGTGIYKNYDLAGSIPVKIADTFEEAINLINIDDDLLY